VAAAEAAAKTLTLRPSVSRSPISRQLLRSLFCLVSSSDAGQMNRKMMQRTRLMSYGFWKAQLSATTNSELRCHRPLISPETWSGVTVR